MKPGSRIRFVSPHGGRPYWIVCPKRWRHKDCDAYFSSEQRRVSVSPEITEARQRELIAHELFHFCASPVHPPQTQEQGIEEVVVLTLEHNLYRLLRRNPQLVRLLFPEVK